MNQCQAWSGTYYRVRLFCLKSGEQLAEFDLDSHDVLPSPGDFYTYDEEKDSFLVMVREFGKRSGGGKLYVSLFGVPAPIGNCFRYDLVEIANQSGILFEPSPYAPKPDDD